MKSEKREKEERKSKNENTRLGRWGIENLTVLPYLRIYFRGLNAIEKKKKLLWDASYYQLCYENCSWPAVPWSPSF